MACALLALVMDVTMTPAAPPRRHWVGTWTASPASGEDLGLTVTDRTIRQIVHTSIGGRRLRMRLANTFGAAPLRIDAVAVALVADGEATSSSRTVTFGGVSSITIPSGARVVSDPVPMRVPADGDVMVSVYVGGTTEPLTWHRFASATTYVSIRGDHVVERSMDASCLRTATLAGPHSKHPNPASTSPVREMNASTWR